MYSVSASYSRWISVSSVARFLLDQFVDQPGASPYVLLEEAVENRSDVCPDRSDPISVARLLSVHAAPRNGHRAQNEQRPSC
jgi:hypothetical protein